MIQTIKIGRDNSNDIEINEPRVSRNHAIITDLGDGNYEIKDLGSTNGTFVNGKRISKQIITPDDRVEVAGALVNWISAFLNPKSQTKHQSIDEEPFSKICKTITIGSSPFNDIILNDQFISGDHAKISLLKNGDYFVRDLGSTNGTFVNGARVSAKNFTKTDVIKLAFSDLPSNWFQHKTLKPRIFRDHKWAWIISISLLLIITGAALYYFYGCLWFGCGCNLSAEKIYLQNKNSIVHITHSYYYTIEFNGKTYFIGKNKLFKVTEANPSNENLLPYNSVEGSGCFIRPDGTILTTFLTANPWLNKSEESLMLKEVFDSKTIEHFSMKETFKVCGVTAELKWLANGLVNNQQNYTEATSRIFCTITDTAYTTIQSVKLSLPENAVPIVTNYDLNKEDHFNENPAYYYSTSFTLKQNSVLQDTFYSARDTFDINKLDFAIINKKLPPLNEGSIVINERGELVGIIQQNKIAFIHRNF
jgi:pSer/pThr/pTyr-binding forkhead associated (FHA) protein